MTVYRSTGHRACNARLAWLGAISMGDWFERAACGNLQLIYQTNCAAERIALIRFCCSFFLLLAVSPLGAEQKSNDTWITFFSPECGICKCDLHIILDTHIMQIVYGHGPGLGWCWGPKYRNNNNNNDDNNKAEQHRYVCTYIRIQKR